MSRFKKAVTALGVVGLVLTAGPGITGAAAATCTTTSADMDRDRMPDCWEKAKGLDPTRVDGSADRDRDGVSNYREYWVDAFASAGDSIFLPFSPRDADSNDNRVEDGDEDADLDGLSNEDEIDEGTLFNDADSDNDGVDDGDEDRDSDGLEDEFELGAVNEDGDPDGDGILDEVDNDDRDGVQNDDEFNPRKGNSDADGTRDGDEDEDNDGLDADEEDEFDTDPDDADTDNDGTDDGEDDSDSDGVDDEDDADGDSDEDASDDDWDDNDVLGSIVSYDSGSKTLTVTTRFGHTIVGQITADTELEWDGADGCGDEATPADLTPGRGVFELEFDSDTGAIERVALVCTAAANDDA